MTNTFKVGDKVRVNSSFGTNLLGDTKYHGVEGTITRTDDFYLWPIRVEFETLESGLFKGSELALIPVRKFTAGDRVYVSQSPYEGVHTIFQVLKDSEPESEFDYTLDRDWTKAVYESEIEALPTEFKEGEWVKVLEYGVWKWWAARGIEVGGVYAVGEDGDSILNPDGDDLLSLYWANRVDASGYGGPTLIKVDAPVSEPTKQEKIDAALKALEDAQNAVDNAANVLSAASDQLDEARAQLKEAVK